MQKNYLKLTFGSLVFAGALLILGATGSSKANAGHDGMYGYYDAYNNGYSTAQASATANAEASSYGRGNSYATASAVASANATSYYQPDYRYYFRDNNYNDIYDYRYHRRHRDCDRYDYWNSSYNWNDWNRWY